MENEAQKFYAVIDLKSFYASVECVERGLDPFKADLVILTSLCVAFTLTPLLKPI